MLREAGILMTDSGEYVKPVIQTFILSATLLLGSFAMAAQAHKDPFPPLSGATLVYGSFDPFFLVIRTPDATHRVLPEPQEPRHETKPIYPSITLDGQQVAAARLRANNPRRVSISVYSIPEKKWTDYGVGTYAGSIAISPDGTKLAFPGQCTQKPVLIHLLNRSTGEETLGPDVADCEAVLNWSPDAKQLVFEAGVPDVRIKIWDLRSNGVKTLVSGRAPAWSPSGEWIAYFYGDGVRAVHPDGTGEKTIVQLPRAGFIIRRQLEFRELPVWSTDSAHLLLNVLMTEEYGMDVLMVDFPSLKKKTVFKNVAPIMGWAGAR
jgi:dipeptidyl aminopeptidase/acylaminoacyl peptidase